ncbi:hypothetical protein ACQ4M3_38505 [Leptolyngbya sp. AN03gr2]|uniref:hypothetical protein n=1 Tax=unclassified Leptolyngbya TaxID=2650499 RepID=UPI003D31D352
MTTVAIVPVSDASGETSYQAIAGNKRSSGKTAGQALDALVAELGETESSLLLVVQRFRPDAFFGEAQQKRLGELMELWRTNRDRGEAVSPEQQAELDQLVEVELEAASDHSAAMIRQLS